MSETEEEWTLVRRRHGSRSGATVKKLKALAIPCVPLAFDALAEPDERPAGQEGANKSKKKKKSKKAKADDDEDEDGDGGHDSSATKAAGASKLAAAGAVGGKTGSAAVASPSLFAWLYSQIVALLVMLGLMKAAAGRKKRKSKAATAAVTVAAPPPPAPAPPAAAAKAAETKAAATPAKKAAAAAAATPAKKVAEAAKEAAAVKPVAATAAAKAVASAAATPLPAAAKASAAAKPEVGAAVGKAPAAGKSAEPKPEPPAAPPPPPPVPRGPPPPTVKCDSDWGRGKFVMQALTAAHSDVVAAVALAGDIAVSAGYDGSVKLWHWPAPGSAGGGVVPRLTRVRNLVGHSGRVEALAAHAAGRRLATSGRDSTLKVWDLGTAPLCADAGELSSTYVYESVRSLAVDWTGGESGGAAGRALLGARSGTVMLYSLAAGGGGRKLAAMRGHGDEVTALQFRGANQAVSGSRDGTVRLWDLRQPAGKEQAAQLNGLSGRVCSLSPLGEHHLLAGDCSTSLKLWDLRMLPPSGSRAPAPEPRRLANAPGFAGDACPTAGLWHGPRSGVVVSSAIAWWTSNKQALEEAPPSTKLPMACLNIAAAGPPTPATAAAAAATPGGAAAEDLLCQYQYTVRLGPGVVTCMAGGVDEGSILAGGATGALWALRLVRGGSAAVAAAERAAEAAAGDGCEALDALVVGAEEFSDDEYGDDEEDEEEDEEEV